MKRSSLDVAVDFSGAQLPVPLKPRGAMRSSTALGVICSIETHLASSVWITWSTSLINGVGVRARVIELSNGCMFAPVEVIVAVQVGPGLGNLSSPNQKK